MCSLPDWVPGVCIRNLRGFKQPAVSSGDVCVSFWARVTIALFIAYLIVAIVEGFSAAYLANGIMGALFPAVYIS